MCRRALPSVVTLVLIAGAAAATVAGYRWLTSAEKFSVRKLEVEGNERISADAIARSLALAQGTNIFAVSLRQLERRLEADPWIERASVTRHLPDTVRVSIRERKAAALVEMDGLYLADAGGEVFKRASIASGEGQGLPVLTGIPRALYVRHPELARADIRRGLELAAMYDNGARPRLGEIHLNSRRRFTIFTYDTGLEIRVGHGDVQTIASRLRFFDAAWRTLDTEERARARTVYVDNTTRPDRVTVAFN